MTPTPVRELENRALTLAAQAVEWTIVDQQSYQAAAERLLAVAALRREILDHHAPMKKAAHEAWQQVIATEKKMLDPVMEAERIYKDKIAEYTGGQRRLEASRQVKAEAEARWLAEEAREREIEQAEGEGADAEEIAAIIAAPLPLPLVAPQATPAFQSARGISTATNWKGEVISLDALVKAVAAGKASSSLVMANETAINQLARATRGTLEVPGIRFFSQSTVRAGSRPSGSYLARK